MNFRLTSSQRGIRWLTLAVISAAALALAAAVGQVSLANEVNLGMLLQAGAKGLCVDNAGSVRAGTALQGWRCSFRNLNQRFVAVKRQKNSAVFRNSLSGFCLDPGKAGVKPGAAITQTRCAAGDGQQMAIVPLPGIVASKGVQLRAKHTGLCLELAQGTHRGSRLIQTVCDGDNVNQRFRFRN